MEIYTALRKTIALLTRRYLLWRHKRIKQEETSPNFQIQKFSPWVSMTAWTMGLASHPPPSRIIIVNNESRMFSPEMETSRKNNGAL
jgi:hypothetical protein